ncbi:MAG: hypothetical protein KJ737_22470 [Proteobacteria bacterium]|nr:hypothetical protein [Pseudomonadota bacterium]
MKTCLVFIFFFLVGYPQILFSYGMENDAGEHPIADHIPERQTDAITGSEFAKLTSGMSGKERQKEAISELKKGNIPDFLRNLKPVTLLFSPLYGQSISGVIWVMPDYLAIGSDDDFMRIPLTYPSSVEIAGEYGFVLPTRKMVDAIYWQSTCRMKPEPLPPCPEMRSSEYYMKHQKMIRKQREKNECQLGDLVSGHKKDIVLTNRLNKKPGRIAIYGWQKQNGEPIQPLSTVHGSEYADYSHGLRLIYPFVWIDGNPRQIADVLQDASLAPLLTYEGLIANVKRLLRLKK